MHAFHAATRRAADRIGPRALCLVLAGLAAGAPATAQHPDPGDVVRITAAGETGRYRFQQLLGDQLVLSAWDGEPVTVPLAAVRRLEIGTRDGRDGVGTLLLRTAGSALVGGSIGLLAGWSAKKDPPPPRRWCFQFPAGEWCYVMQLRPETYAREGALYGALAGGAAGLLYSLLNRRWRWEPVAVRDLAVGLAADPNGLGVQVTWQP